MISFKDIFIDDKELIQSYTVHCNRRNCDLSFANLYSWKFLYQTKFAIVENMLTFRFYVGEQLAYMMPVGDGDIRKVIKCLREDARNMGSKLYIVGMGKDMKEKMEMEFPNMFTYTSDRDFADYIYLRSDLADLKGKKYQPKRNHINRFKSLYPTYEYMELTPALVPECLKLEEIWCRANNCEEQAELAAERRSMNFALNHMEELNLTGGVLHVDGRIVAFTYGGVINEDTWDVCVEKADISVEGSYTMINNEYVRRIDEKYEFVNREEDLGIEGLRKAKMSYHPYLILEKYIAEIK